MIRDDSLDDSNNPDDVFTEGLSCPQHSECWESNTWHS